jgi:hypothetical protein
MRSLARHYRDKAAGVGSNELPLCATFARFDR